MKIFLLNLSLLTIISNAVFPIFNNNKQANFTKHYYQKPTSLLSISKIVDQFTQKMPDFIKWKNGNVESREAEESKTVWNMINNDIEYNSLESGSLNSFNTIPISEQTIETFTDKLTNNSDNNANLITYSHSKSITNSSTFSWSLSESLSVAIKLKFKFGEAQIDTTISSTQLWNKTTSETDTITSPSKEFVVKPHSTGIATTIIKQGSYQSSGELQYLANNQKITLLSSQYLSTFGDIRRFAVPIGTQYGIISELANDGYSEMMRNKVKSFSILSTDNPYNPKLFTINLPISWTSQGGETDVVYDNN